MERALAGTQRQMHGRGQTVAEIGAGPRCTISGEVWLIGREERQ
jgi:hypothetical protein